jgi:hypothetical protein
MNSYLREVSVGQNIEASANFNLQLAEKKHNVSLLRRSSMFIAERTHNIALRRSAICGAGKFGFVFVVNPWVAPE